MTSTAETLHRVALSEDKTVRERMLCDARDHLRFILEDLIPAQIARDGKFVLVLRWHSSSWESPIVKALVENEAVAWVRVCQDTNWLTNDGEIAEVFNADVWKLLEREVVKLGNFAPKVANAFLLALRSSLQLCGRGAALCLEGNLDQPTISSLETGPVLEEPNLVEHPPTSGELKEVWGRSTGLPLDSRKVVVARREEMEFMAQFGVTIPSSLQECHDQTGPGADTMDRHPQG